MRRYQKLARKVAALLQQGAPPVQIVSRLAAFLRSDTNGAAYQHCLSTAWAACAGVRFGAEVQFDAHIIPGTRAHLLQRLRDYRLCSRSLPRCFDNLKTAVKKAKQTAWDCGDDWA